MSLESSRPVPIGDYETTAFPNTTELDFERCIGQQVTMLKAVRRTTKHGEVHIIQGVVDGQPYSILMRGSAPNSKVAKAILGQELEEQGGVYEFKHPVAFVPVYKEYEKGKGFDLVNPEGY